MSRIHDALKKAEEQRLTGLGSNAQQNVAAQDSIPSFSAESEVAVPSQEYQVPIPAEPKSTTVSVLLESCSRVSWSPSKDALFLNGTSANSPGLEEFRTLRSKLFQWRSKKPLKTVLVSSALPSEGKSFVSANLAQAFSRQRGGRTLLIDADLRKPQLHNVLGAPDSPGLYEFLAGTASAQEIVQRSSTDELFFIPAGNVSTGAAELIGNGKLHELFDLVSPLFNWIVIDSSPVVLVSDAAQIADHCDGVLLVVKSGGTPRDVAERAVSEFDGAPLLGVVLNQIPEIQYPYYYKYSYSK